MTRATDLMGLMILRATIIRMNKSAMTLRDLPDKHFIHNKPGDFDEQSEEYIQI